MDGGEVLGSSGLGQAGDYEVVKEDGKGHFEQKEGFQGWGQSVSAREGKGKEHYYSNWRIWEVQHKEEWTSQGGTWRTRRARQIGGKNMKWGDKETYDNVSNNNHVEKKEKK